MTPRNFSRGATLWLPLSLNTGLMQWQSLGGRGEEAHSGSPRGSSRLKTIAPMLDKLFKRASELPALKVVIITIPLTG